MSFVKERTARFKLISQAKDSIVHRVHEASKALEAILRGASKHHKELRILVTGKTGQGKSTLINGILNAKVAEEGATADRVTTEVKMHSKTIKGVPIKVFDSPGLQDCTANEEEYIQGMRNQCKELSLILYCTKMVNTRLTDEDKNAMMKLTNAFGEDFWNYAVFVLTFANMEDVERHDGRDEDDGKEEPDYNDEKAWQKLKKKRFKGRLKNWEDDLRHFLVREVGVSEKIASGIPVVPTGDHKTSRSNKEPNRLPDRDNWFHDYWEACCLRVKTTRLFLQVNSSRMVAQDNKEVKNAENAQPTVISVVKERLESPKLRKYATSPSSIKVTDLAGKSHERQKGKAEKPPLPERPSNLQKSGMSRSITLPQQISQLASAANQNIELNSSSAKKILQKAAMDEADDKEDISTINDIIQNIENPSEFLIKISSNIDQSLKNALDNKEQESFPMKKISEEHEPTQNDSSDVPVFPLIDFSEEPSMVSAHPFDSNKIEAGEEETLVLPMINGSKEILEDTSNDTPLIDLYFEEDEKPANTKQILSEEKTQNDPAINIWFEPEEELISQASSDTPLIDILNMGQD